MPRDLNKSIEQIERATWKVDARPAPAVKVTRPPRSPTAWRADDARPRETLFARNNVRKEAKAMTADQRPETLFPGNNVRRETAAMTPDQRPATSAKLTAKSLKVVVPLDAGEVLEVGVSEGQARVHFKINSDMGELRAETAAKSVRRAQALIREKGADAVFCMLQGRLVRGEITECGLSAQLKASKVPVIV
jgi:hypothetical protein